MVDAALGTRRKGPNQANDPSSQSPITDTVAASLTNGDPQRAGEEAKIALLHRKLWDNRREMAAVGQYIQKNDELRWTDSYVPVFS